MTGFSAQLSLGLGYVNTTGNVYPYVDDTDTLGLLANRYLALYTSRGVQFGDTSAHKPTCDVNARGRIYTTQGGAGVQDLTEQCTKLTSGSYVWAALSTSVTSSGSDQTIEVDITAAAGNFDSATVIPSGAVVKSVWVNVGRSTMARPRSQ